MTKHEPTEISTKAADTETKKNIFTKYDRQNCLRKGNVVIHERFIEDPYFEDPYTFFVGVYLENKTAKPCTFLSVNDLAFLLYNASPNQRQKKNVRDAVTKMINDNMIICERNYGNGNYLVNMINWRTKKLEGYEKKDDHVVVEANPWDDWGEQIEDNNSDSNEKKPGNGKFTIIDGEYPGYYEAIPMDLFIECIESNSKITAKATRLKFLTFMEKITHRWSRQNEDYQKYFGKVAVFSQNEASEALGVSETSIKNYISWLEENKIIIVARATVTYNKRKYDDDKPSIERASNVYAWHRNIDFVNDYIHQPRLKGQNYVLSGQGKIKLTAK